jgi:hypothetical protein
MVHQRHQYNTGQIEMNVQPTVQGYKFSPKKMGDFFQQANMSQKSTLPIPYWSTTYR